MSIRSVIRNTLLAGALALVALPCLAEAGRERDDFIVTLLGTAG